jgi:dihydropteroate synthase
MQDNPTYVDVVGEVATFLETMAERARAAVPQLWLDPGIGFGKTVEHNLALLRTVTTSWRWRASTARAC